MFASIIVIWSVLKIVYDLGVKPMLLHGNGSERSTHNGTQTVNHNLEHEILFHEQTLQFLKDNRNLRRPCTSLRVKGLNCLPPEDQIRLLSSFETRALEKAISTKQDVIRNLREQFDSAPEVDWHLYSTPNWTFLNKHGQGLTRNSWLNESDKKGPTSSSKTPSYQLMMEYKHGV